MNVLKRLLMLIGLVACAPTPAQLPVPLAHPSLDLRAASAARTAVGTVDGGVIVSHDGRWLGGEIERPRLAKLRADGSVDSSWQVEPDGTVFGITIDGDDVYLAGTFGSINGSSRQGLAKVSLSSGALSPWNPNAGSNSSYRFDSFAIVNGWVYVGGTFTQVGSASRALVAKINASTGAVDPAFVVAVTATGSSDVAVRTDGTSLFVGGFFSAVNGVARGNVAKLSLVDGAVDPLWSPSFNSTVLRLEVEGGLVYAAGCFTEVSGIARVAVARVSTTGSGAVDADWNPAPQNGACLYGLNIGANHVYLGGFLSQLGNVQVQRIGRVAKLGTGAPDPSWRPATDGFFTFGAVPGADGSVLVLGDFISVGGVYSPGIVRVGPTGAPQLANAYSEQRGYVQALAAAPDGGTYVGGWFHRIGAVLRRGVLRLTPSGTLDSAWAPTLAGRGNVMSLVRDANHLYIGGELSTAGTPTAFNLIRVSHAGSVDGGWSPVPSGPVAAMAIDEAADSVLIGGDFTSVAGQPRNRLAEISRTTGQATGFNPNVNGRVRTLALAGSSVFLGGNFSSVGGVARSRLAKVSRAGVVDPSFSADADSSVSALLPGPNGTLYVGGQFSSLGGLGRRGLARLSQANGAPDASWTTFPNGSVSAISPAVDGIQIGGSFTAMGSEPRRNLARVTHANQVASLFAPSPDLNVLAVLEQDSRLFAGGFLGYWAPTEQRRIGLHAYPRDATPVSTSLTITSDLPEHTQPFQFYRVEVSAVGGGLPLSGQRVLVQCDSGVACETTLDGAGNGACELASRTPGVRILTARFAGTPLFSPATDTETHNVAGIAATPPANPAFDLRSPGTVRAAARTNTGGLVIGGSFNRVGDAPRRNLARLQSDGNLDTSFSADVIGWVGGLAADSSGSVYVAGGFDSIGGVFRRNVAKLDAAGNVVPSWIPARTDHNGNAAQLDEAGNLILQGGVSFVSGSPNYYRTSLFKLAGTNGALISEFAVEVTSASTSAFPTVRVRSHGPWLYVYGRFDAINGIARRNLARISAAGAVDAAWDPSPDGLVRAVEPDAIGGLYVAGEFSGIGAQNVNNRLVRLTASGTVDASFAPAPNAWVTSMVLDGSALHVAGSFSSIGGIARTYLAKLDAGSGVADAGFAQYDTTLFAPNILERLGGGALWIATSAFQMSPTAVVSMGAVRIDPTSGQQLPVAPVSRPAFVYALARQPDGALLLGGYFARAGGGQRNLVRITPSGQFDTAFLPLLNPPNWIAALAVRGNGDIYAGGLSLRKLSPAGAVDTAFASTAGGAVYALLDAGDGLIAGGNFTAAGDQSLPRSNIAKLDYASGEPAAGWAPQIQGWVEALAMGAGGAVYVGGGFTSVNEVPRQRLAKLDANGSLDTAWQPQANSAVRALLVDGQAVYLGGYFSSIDGATRLGLAKVDGSSGALEDWAPGGIGPGGVIWSGPVFALARAQDGGILAGGAFRTLGGAYRSNAGKLDPTSGAADPLWNPSLDAPVYALLAGYGNTPAVARLAAVEQNIAIGGEFEFQGAAPMPGFVAVPSVGQPTTDGLFCDGFESTGCAPLP